MKCPIILPNKKVTITRIGLRIDADLTFEEWRDMAATLGDAARSIGFIVGDWLVYGQNLFGTDGFPDRKVDEASYTLAVAATGLDLSTLQNYAYVSRNVPYSLRDERLSWEHHKIVAKLDDAEQQRWLAACVAENEHGRHMSARRLRKSLALGRVATEEDMEPDDSDNGIRNHIPFVNRLVGWWKRMQQERFLSTSTREQRDALKRDLEPVVNIYNQL